MNIKAKTIFQLITNASCKLQSEVVTALETYQEEKAEAHRITAKYKDEQTEYEQRRAFLANVARERIDKASRVFSATVEEQAKSLREELMEHLNTPLKIDFVNQLALIREYELKPTKSEIQHLIMLNDGNSIGLSALRSVLESNQAEYKLIFSGTADFEKDLEIIEGFTEFPMYIPVNLHSEGVEVYQKVQRSFKRADGSSYQDGRTWDSLSINAARADFEGRVKAIEGMSDRWTTDASYPSVEAVYTARKEESDNTDEPIQSEPESSVQIQENDGAIENARAIGKITAEGQRKYDEAIDTYLKK